MQHATVSSPEGSGCPDTSAPAPAWNAADESVVGLDESPGHGADGPSEPPEAGVLTTRDAVHDAVRQTATQARWEVGAHRYPRLTLARADAVPDLPSDPSPVLAELLVHLRATVVAYVERRRDEGAPVQRVFPEVKALVREAASRERVRHSSELLLDQVVRWCIQAYYAGAATSPNVAQSWGEPGPLRA